MANFFCILFFPVKTFLYFCTIKLKNITIMKKLFLLLFVAVSMSSCIFYSHPSSYYDVYSRYHDYSYHYNGWNVGHPYMHYTTYGVVEYVDYNWKNTYAGGYSVMAIVRTNTTYTLIDITNDPHSLKVGDIVYFN